METKYGFEVKTKVMQKNVTRLTNQLWKLIPMREHEEDWKKQLKTVTLEIAGMNEIFEIPQFLQLLTKLEGLGVNENLDFEMYRKTVFESISLLQEIYHGFWI